MTREEALKILDLDANYTEEQLRTNYKKKMRIWHPDISKEKNAEEMAKKINEAKAILEQKNTEISFDSSINIEKLKLEIVNSLIEKYLDKINSREDINKYDFITRKTINNIILKIEVLESVIEKCNNQIPILNAYKICNIEIKNTIRKYILEYCIAHSIAYDYTKKNQIVVNSKVLHLDDSIVNIFSILNKEKKEDDMIDKIEDNTYEFISKVKKTTKKTYDKTKDVVGSFKNKVKKYIKH